MNTTNINIDKQDDRIKSQKIRKAISNHCKEMERKYGILKHQDALGLGILSFSIGIFIVSSLCYLNGYIAWWGCIIINALCLSVVHEIEHDLIHSLYFKRNRVMHNIMMAIVWSVRPSTANPWVRRKIHLRHHQMPGTYEDLEERLLSNGQRWGLLRLWMISDFIVATAVVILQAKSREEKRKLFKKALKAFFPLSVLHSLIAYSFIIFHLINIVSPLLGVAITWSEMTLKVFNVIDVVMVIITAPNILWSFCLHFVSSNMHYYGDNESGNTIQETQVLNPWWLLPFNLFCFNFGSTHAIHHFVVNEPFYIRQLSAPFAHKVMKDMGVRFNDVKTFNRANRWGENIIK
ncbi:fatty acid desaturase [Yersinia canariae]|uniref:Fatty acid desaturase n=1 Tax=Yersinia canariae TaxID=2607663 RepID=A0A857F0Q5_9GAMM|nr:fatty acid desaturase [Yersinia canariae]QHB32931.1 fatty acid desaturase [Yersinia canariae]